jgi:serine/threonine protein kinase
MKRQPRYQPGDKIGGRYQVPQALLGGTGEVYLCLDRETYLPFALKTFQQRYLTTSTNLRHAFENEVVTWVALEKHPNIVRCFFLDILDNQPFMFLEWIAGEKGRGTDLRSWLRRGPLDLRLALDFTIDICRGLIHAQEKQPGIVHRDLKPENILIAQGRLAKITDFGLAQIVQAGKLEITNAEGEMDGRQSLLGQGGIVGTPLYMAPEQWRGEALDARTDIYAVGCILYELLTGSWPFQATALDSLRHQHLEAFPPKLGNSRNLPSVLDSLLDRCLAKPRKERFATLDDLELQLAHFYQQQFNESPKDTPGGIEFDAIDHTQRGVAYFNLQDYDRALSDFTQAIQLDHSLAPAYYNRGHTYDTLQQYEDALSDLSRAIQLDHNYAAAYYNRGGVYNELEQYDKALADFSRAIQLEPEDAQAYYGRGTTYPYGQNTHQYRDINILASNVSISMPFCSASNEAYNWLIISS